MSFAGKSVIWIHCASLGEFEQGRPVIESIRKEYPRYHIVLSFFSPSGYEIRKNYDKADLVIYLPADTRSNGEKLIGHIQPKLAVFIKYEFWYHYIKACYDRNIPVISVSTILRPQQVFFKPYGKFYRKILSMFRYFYVQNEHTLDLLKSIGITRVMVSGDTRFDRVFDIFRHSRSLPLVEGFCGPNKIIVLGSTWKPDIDLWKEYINSTPVDISFIIAPHHIEETELQYIERQIQISSIRYSRLAENSREKHQLLIMDNIGMLSSLYQFAFIAYVGGSMSEGLHNILEPATYGVPILIGKDKSNVKYQEAIDLIKQGGAFEMDEKEKIPLMINRFMKDRTYYEETCRLTKKYIDINRGATGKIMNSLKPLLN